MKKFYLSLIALLVTSITSIATINQTNSLGTHQVIVRGSNANQPTHLSQPIDCPEVFYISQASIITIDFGNQPVNNYTVTISSLYADVDYYVTSSFTTIPLAVDGFSDYSIVIETADGDVFEGILTASDYTTSQTI